MASNGAGMTGGVRSGGPLPSDYAGMNPYPPGSENYRVYQGMQDQYVTEASRVAKNTGAIAGTQSGAQQGTGRMTEGSITGMPSPGDMYRQLVGGLGATGSSSSSSSSSGGTYTPPPTIGGGGSGGGSLAGLQAAVAPIAPIDTTEAQRGAFGAAKDQVGLETSGALMGLRSALGSRGMLGSGSEGRGIENIVMRGQGELGDVSRTQASEKAGQALDLAKTNQGAALVGRGQDLGAQESANSLAVTQRGQDIAAQTAANSLAMQQTLAQAGQRQEVLNGLLAALNGRTY